MTRPAVSIPLLCCLLGAAASAPQSEWKRVTPVRRDLAAERERLRDNPTSTSSTPMPQITDSPQPQPMRAIRLIFEYEGDQVRLVSRQPVDVAVTGFDLAQTAHPGYYVDVRSASDQTLARVAARDAFAGSLEVFPENPAEPITRVDDTSRRGAFTVIVPAPDNSDHVTLMEMRAPAPGVREAGAAPAAPTAVDLVSFSLTPDR